MTFNKTNWYIKYDDSITKENFDEFRQFMTNSGWFQKEHYVCGLLYEDFQKHLYIRHKKLDEEKNSWCIDNNKNDTELKIKMSDIMKLKLNKFKAGDKVRIKNTDSVKSWSIGPSIIGQVGIIDYNSNFIGHTYFINNNQYGINFKDNDLELYVEEQIELIKGEYYVANCRGKFNDGSKMEEYIIKFDKIYNDLYLGSDFYAVNYAVNADQRICSEGAFRNIVRKATEGEKAPFLIRTKQSKPHAFEIGDEVEIVSLHEKGGKVGDVQLYSGVIGHREVIIEVRDKDELSYDKNPIILKKPRKTKLITCEL